jgi:hypothetical protein
MIALPTTYAAVISDGFLLDLLCGAMTVDEMGDDFGR